MVLRVFMWQVADTEIVGIAVENELDTLGVIEFELEWRNRHFVVQPRVFAAVVDHSFAIFNHETRNAVTKELELGVDGDLLQRTTVARAVLFVVFKRRW